MSEPVFFTAVPLTLEQIAAETGAELKAPHSAQLIISSAAPIEAATPGAITFIDNPRYARHAETTQAAAVICSQKHAGKIPPRVSLLIHENPYRAYAKVLRMLFPMASRPEPVTGETGISGAAFVSDGVLLESDIIVEAGAVIGRNAAIGKGSRILAGAVIGANVQIGRNTTVGVNASVTHAFVGNNVIIHPGVRIGQDGFGFAMGPGGHDKIMQIGRVVIQDDVEIGANSTIDRGANRDTVIGEGTKIDNLVQIGHNVVVGRHCVIVGLVGIAGSATLGDYVVIAGQAGIGGHVHIGDGAQVGGGAGVHTNIKPGEKVIGYPAMDVRSWMKMNVMLKSMITKKSDQGAKDD